MHVIRPVSPLTETVARIQLDEGTIQIEFPERRDDFGEVVKQYGCIWQRPYWERDIDNQLAGDPLDRLVEIAHKLLNAGFNVAVPSSELQTRIADGDFAPEVRRWVLVVTKGEHKNWFALKWHRRDDFYDKAMALPGARYLKPYVGVPPEQFEMVMDFAEVHGFAMSDSAEELAEKVQELMLTAVVFSPSEYEEIEADEELEEVHEIDDELADEPL